MNAAAFAPSALYAYLLSKIGTANPDERPELVADIFTYCDYQDWYLFMQYNYTLGISDTVVTECVFTAYGRRLSTYKPFTEQELKVLDYNMIHTKDFVFFAPLGDAVSS